MSRKFLLGLPVAALLTGCVTLPMYEPAAGEAVAVIEANRLPSVAFCTDAGGYSVKPGSDGAIRVPANTRVSLYSSLVLVDYQVTYTCTPGASYIFDPTRRYVARVANDSQGCDIDLVQLSDESETGVAIETSGLAPVCNPWANPARPLKPVKRVR